MHLSHLLFVLIALAAQSHCATLRQYSRDWLIASEEPMYNKEPRRIMAKSVFIAPEFHPVRCSQGYREDAQGNCVKLVRVSQTAQLDFLLHKLNAMYGSSGKPANSPFSGIPKPESTIQGDIANPEPLDVKKPEHTSVSDVVKREPVPLDSVETPLPTPVAGTEPTKSEPCIELPHAGDVAVTTPSTSVTSFTTESSTAESSSQKLSVVYGQEVVETTLPSSTPATVPEVTEVTSSRVPEVLLIGEESELLGSSTQNVSAVVEKEVVPIVSGDDEISVLESTSVKDEFVVEMNDQAVKDVVVSVDKKVPAAFESATQVLILGSAVSVNPLDKDVSVKVIDEATTTLTPESTTVVDEEASTNDYDYDFLIEPEMGSGEVERDVENVSEEALSAVGDTLQGVEMIDLNNSSEADKVMPVRNIVPEASSERIQFIDSPITNIQPVRNTYPDGDEVLEVDLKPSENLNGATVQLHNLNPSKLLPPKYMEEPTKTIPDTPFSLEDFINQRPVPPIPVYRPYENLNFNPQQQNFPLQYQQPPLPPRTGFVRFPNDREQNHADQRVNSVRFPPGEQFSDETLRHWPSTWTLDQRRVQRPRPLMRFWNKMPLIRNSDESSQRYQPDRRRPPPQFYQ